MKLFKILALAMVFMLTMTLASYALVLVNQQYQTDYVVLFNAGTASAKYPAPQQMITFASLAALPASACANMAPGEPVFLASHGCAGLIGQEDAASISALLQRCALPRTAPVYLLSCEAGLESPYTHLSLARDLGQRLGAAGYTTVVTGALGLSIIYYPNNVPQASAAVVVKEGYDGVYFTNVQDPLTLVYQPQQQIDAYLASHAASPLASTAAFAYNNGVIRQFYSALYASSAAYGYSYPANGSMDAGILVYNTASGTSTVKDLFRDPANPNLRDYTFNFLLNYGVNGKVQSANYTITRNASSTAGVIPLNGTTPFNFMTIRGNFTLWEQNPISAITSNVYAASGAAVQYFSGPMILLKTYRR